MRIQLEPVTEAGAKQVALAEEHATDFATRADQHDRENSFPYENFEAMYKSGYMAAAVPEELGGLGMESVFDGAVGTNRIARGCGATGLASNMARGAIFGAARQWQALKARGIDGPAAALEATLRGLVDGTVGFCGANSEPGTDPVHVRTTATKTADGWVLSGYKIFATASPVATSIGMMVRYDDPERGARLVLARVPRDTPGMTINDDWDAMGMRGTGSPSVELKDCRIPLALANDVGPYGVLSPETPFPMFLGVGGGLGQASAFLGVAESAQDYVIERLRTERRGGTMMRDRHAVQRYVAENEIDLAASVALILRGADREQRHHEITRSGDVAEMHELIKESQIGRRFVTEAAVRVVDRAMTIAGGSGYMTASPLSRMYRDVRAGPVMPMTPIDVYEYIGQVTLGMEPDIWGLGEGD